MANPYPINVNPEVLRWARERASLKVGALAKHKELSNYHLLEAGKAVPSLAQIRLIAHKTHVSSSELFLPKPPKEQIPPIQDFRTVGSGDLERPSTELLDMITLCFARQSWYQEHCTDERTSPLKFVGSASLDSDPKKVAAQIRSKLRLGMEERAHLRGWEKTLAYFVKQTEEAGIMVMTSGVYGNNTTRPFKVKEFRGFALVDEFAPLIFINGNDTKAAQMFTLSHEIAHVWLGKTGISNDRHDRKPKRGVEAWCNNVAAEVLVPAQDLRKAIDKTGLDNKIHDEVKRLSVHFKVSTLVIIRKLHAEGFITQEKFKRTYGREWSRLKKKSGGSIAGGGGIFYRMLRNRAGVRFSSALVNRTLDGESLYIDALRLLGIRKLSTFDKFAKAMG